MNNPTETSLLINKMGLPDSFNDIVREFYRPLADLITSRVHNEPLLVSINGAQGTGKSTLTSFLKVLIEAGKNHRVAEFSLDDFYLTRAQRQKLAEQVHPLFITRGVPGTHDLDLMESVIGSLLEGQSSTAPKFDKAADDRCDPSAWTRYDNVVDIILFEGWCNSSPTQGKQELQFPINELESKEDEQGIWRHYSNEQLRQYHERVYDRAELCIMLKAPDFERIFEWRQLQEQKLQDDLLPSQQDRTMNDGQLKRFIQHYERISQHTLLHLPDKADVVLPISHDHSITGLIENHA